MEKIIAEKKVLILSYFIKIAKLSETVQIFIFQSCKKILKYYVSLPFLKVSYGISLTQKYNLGNKSLKYSSL